MIRAASAWMRLSRSWTPASSDACPRARTVAKGRIAPLSGLSLRPAPRGPGCLLGGKQVTFESQGYGPDGVRQFLLQYRSPVLPALAKPIQAYLTLPPGYSPTGSYPAVVVTHGHHDADKESLARCPDDSDHANALVLAKHGAITLAPDTITFGDYDTHEGDAYPCAFRPADLTTGRCARCAAGQ